MAETSYQEVELRAQRDNWHTIADERAAEIERLRKDMARLLATSKTGGSDTCITCAAHVLVITEDLEPEIERLRAALERIAHAKSSVLNAEQFARADSMLQRWAADALNKAPPDETTALQQKMHSDEWWQAELDRCVGIEQAKYRALFETVSRYGAALRKIQTKHYGCCGADGVATEALESPSDTSEKQL
jgi:hypothetical protein